MQKVEGPGFAYLQGHAWLLYEGQCTVCRPRTQLTKKIGVCDVQEDWFEQSSESLIATFCKKGSSMGRDVV